MSDTPDHAALERRAEDFVRAEARLLDERRYNEWAALFAPEGWYWMPAAHDASAPGESLSILHENRRLLELRARRLAHPSIHVESPPSRCHHHLSSVAARAEADGRVRVESMQLVVTLRGGEQHLASLRCEHVLATEGAGFAILSKTVRRLDCELPLRGFAAPL